MNSRSASRQEGFTYIEVLVALAIISLSGYVIWMGFSSGLQALEKIYEKSRVSAELVIFERLFRREVNKLCVPYWEKEGDYGELLISNEVDFLSFNIDGKIHRFSYITMKELKMLEKGIEIDLQLRGDGAITLFQRFGSFPITGSS